jgi:hypothetical protein
MHEKNNNNYNNKINLICQNFLQELKMFLLEIHQLNQIINSYQTNKHNLKVID